LIQLTVITINFNNREGLQKTLQSVVAQKDALFEYVVIDGGSTDGSLEVIKQFENKINYWVSEKDSGIYNAMNKGIKIASGNFLLFLNSGDFLVDDKVLKRVLLKDLDKDIVYGDMMINWGNGKITKGEMPDQLTLPHMCKDTLWHPVSFIRRELFETFGLYDETYKLVGDYEFFFRTIIGQGVTSKRIPVVITEYNTQGLSSRQENKTLEKTERKRVVDTYLTPEQKLGIEKRLATEKKRPRNWFNFFKNKF
jgi:glycosyltransferase involved in cell wall biosynthesis